MPSKEQKGTIPIIILFAAIGLLLYLGITSLVYFKDSLLKQLYPKPETEALEDSVKSLTDQLVIAHKEYQTAVADASQKVSAPTANTSTTSSQVKKVAEKKDKLKAISQKRKEELLQLLNQDPQKFLDKAVLTKQRDNFPEEVKQDIEEKVQKEGKIFKYHGHSFTKHTETEMYGFVDKQGGNDFTHHFPLIFAKKPNIKDSLGAKITAVSLANNLVIDYYGSNATITSLQTQKMDVPAPPPVVASPGVQKTALVLVDFYNPRVETRMPFTGDQVKQLLFGSISQGSSTGVVNRFYDENSSGKTYFTVDVYDNGGNWYKISEDLATCDLFKWSQDADNLVHIDHTKYNQVIYFFPTNNLALTLCRNDRFASGFLTQPNVVWIFYSGISEDLAGAVIHELGHSLGVGHANGLDCDQPPLGGNCRNVEYADSASQMGSAQLTHPHFNIGFKAALQYINLPPTITQSGTYQIYKSELSNNSPTGLRIFRSTSSNYFYLEYRQPVSFDQNLPSNITNGVFVHIWDIESKLLS